MGLDPGDAEAFLGLGRVRLRLGDRDHARRARGLRARALARKDPRRARRGGARSLVERFDIESYSDFSAK